MKKYKYILFTAGRGPVECSMAVHGIQRKFKKEIEQFEIDYSIVKQNLGQVYNSMDTIVFKVEDVPFLNSWLGTIQWICKSPVRKFHKRKNWFIKCCELTPPDSKESLDDELIIQTYKASGPGGQHRNKVETAVRIIHKSTGIIVTASESRSKSQNLKVAHLKMAEKLKNRQRELEMEYNFSQWENKIEIERGSPAKVFYSEKFIEV